MTIFLILFAEQNEVTEIVPDVPEVQETDSIESNPVHPVTTTMQPIIIQMAPPPASIIQPAAVFQSVKTVPLLPPKKLPLPKVGTSAASSLVNVYSTPIISSQSWRLPREKMKRKKRVKKSSPNETNSVTDTTTTNDKEESEFVKILTSESVPKTILASQDANETTETEVVDLTEPTKSDKKEENIESAKKKLKTKEITAKTKTKSSYSIAALCQMSVNIGADPAAGVPDPNAAGVSSPGVISLNSNTESPRATPTPQSPKPPPPKPLVQTSKSKLSKKVIEELKPVGDKVVPNEIQQPTSPTKSYLTQFPVVKDQKSKEPPKPKQTAEKPKPKEKPKENLPKIPVTTSAQVPSKMPIPQVPSQANQTIPPTTPTGGPIPASGPRQDYGPPIPTPYNQYTDFSRQPYNKNPPQMQNYKHKDYRSIHTNMNMPTSTVPPNNPTVQFPMQENQQMGQHYNQQVMGTEQADSFFSVNQLVNPKNQFQMVGPFNAKKPTKRSTSSTATASTSRYQKQARPEVKIDPKKDETRKNTKNSTRQTSSSSRGSTSRSSSSQASKRSYTAESLLSTHGGQSDYHTHSQVNQQRSSNYPRVSTDKSSNRMPELNWNVDSSGSATGSHFAPFPSISPSPNLFSQDFGSFDFPMFGTTDMSAHQKPRKDHTRYDMSSNQQNQPQQVHQQDFHHQDSTQQQQQLFDANFFSTTGTLTPPSVAGVYPSHDESYINFATTNSGMNPATTTSSSRQYKRQQVHQQQQQSMDQHHMSQRSSHMIDHQGYSSQQQILLSSNNQSVPASGSSYSNFNLSTIFPEINVPGLPPTDKIAALLPTVPPPPPLPTTATPSRTSTSISTSLPSATPEILPHSISIFSGHHAPHQMSFASVPFSAASFHSSSASAASSAATQPPTANSSINFGGIHEQ